MTLAALVELQKPAKPPTTEIVVVWSGALDALRQRQALWGVPIHQRATFDLLDPHGHGLSLHGSVLANMGTVPTVRRGCVER